MPPPCPSPCPIVLPHTPGAFCHGDLTPQRGQARLQPPWSLRWSRAGNAGRGSCFPGDVSEGCIVSGRGRSGAARQRMSLHCPPCSARAIFKLGGSSWPFCGPSALLCGMPQLSVASPSISQPLRGCRRTFRGLAWRRSEGSEVPCPLCLAGALSEAAFPGALASAKVVAGLGAAGGRAGNRALPAPPTTS